MKNSTLLLAMPALVIACGGGAPGTPSPAESALAYAVPAQATLAYVIGDTTAISMNMGAQTVDVNAASRSLVELTFTPAGDRTSATVRFTELDGRFSSSMGGTMSVSNADLPEPAVIDVNRTGDVTVTTLPEMTETVQQVLGTQSAFKRMFPPLPGRAVQRGASWTDTTVIEDQNGGVTSTTNKISTSTLAGDTTVNGRPLQIIRTDAQVTATVAGTSQGFELRQSLSGTSQGVTLWDAALRAIYEHTETAAMSGTMELPAMGASGIPVVFESRQVMRLGGQQ